MPHTVLKQVQEKYFINRKHCRYFVGVHGNQRWNQQAESSSAFSAPSKSSSAASVIEASATAQLVVPKWLALMHKKQRVIAINKAGMVGLNMRFECALTDAANK
jgi:hypothetical protein